MGRRRGRRPARREVILSPAGEACLECGRFMRVAYTYRRTVVRLDGLWRLVLRVRRCGNPACARYHRAYGPEEAGAWALPQSEFGLDIIAQIGHWRAYEQLDVPHQHPAPRARRVGIAATTVTQPAHRQSGV